MNVDIGEMRTRVEYQARAQVGKDQNGQPVYRWDTLWTGDAAVRPLSQKEVFYSGGQTAQRLFRIFLRHRPGVSTEGRLKLAEGRYLYLTSVLNLEERSTHLDCQAVEKTA